MYLTLPISYFYVWKKHKENEEIIVTRLGRVQKRSKGSFQKLPFIDSEVSICLDPKTSIINKHLLITLDKAAVLVGVDVTWRVSDAVVAYKSASNYEECFLNALRPVLRRRIERTVIRVLATEQTSLECKLRSDFNFEGEMFGISVDAVSLKIEASAAQPYLNPNEANPALPADPMAAIMDKRNAGAPIQLNSRNIGNFGDALRTAGASLPPDLMKDIIGGLANHPGFSNILEHMPQSKSSNPTNSSEIPLKTTSDIVAFFESENLKLTKRLDLIVDDETFIITDSGIHRSLNDIDDQLVPAAEIKISAETLIRLIAKEETYLEAYQAGKVTFSGDASLIKELLQLIQ